MMSESKAFLLASAEEWELPITGQWTFLLNNNYQPQSSNINLLWFHDADLFPRVVTKIFRKPEIPKREFENLTQVYRSVPTWVPKPWHFGLHGEFWMLWMEGVPGLRFGPGNNLSPANLRAIAEILALMHSQLRHCDRRPDTDRYRRTVSEPLQTVARFGASASVVEGCINLIARSRAEWIDRLPVIAQHGDLVLSNVLFDRGGWHIVDWDGWGIVDIPFYDLITFLYSVLVPGGETPEHWDPSVVKQVPVLIHAYAQALNLSTSDLSLLLPLILMNWFHLKWSDCGHAFTDRMYKVIEHYFEHQNLWEKVFLSAY